MIEPPRLLDRASGIERAILESAVDDEPSLERRRRVVASIGTAAAAVSATSLASRLGFWKAVACVGAVAAAGTGVAAVCLHRAPSDLRESRVSEPLPVPSGLAANVAAREPEIVAPAESASSVATAASAAPVVAVVPRVPAVRAVASEEPPVPSISQEIALIDAARAAKSKGDSDRALAVLDDYDRRWPNGTMTLEAAVLRIEALAAAGNEDEAAERARVFLAAHPKSTYDARVRAYAKNP